MSNVPMIALSWVIRKDSQRVVLLSKIVKMKGYQPQASKGKGAGVKSRGDWAQASKSSSPVESHRVHLGPLAVSCDNMCDVASQGSSQETCVPRDFIGVWSASAYQVPKFQTPERNAGVEPKLSVCTDGQSEPL